ncbi:MAG: AbrB/MazE/SpoVT family DNA-binding domain-containing protein [Candidatus Heimdallarchaeota archaeon]|nr:AbrB/MazE/SpoVT family DNA-binding domain-containing protein [Candidatus Heimdallarchaeota archaeon]
MKFLGSAKLYGKNQITIPKEVVEEMDLKQGDQILFLQDANGHLYVVTEVALPENKKSK